MIVFEPMKLVSIYGKNCYKFSTLHKAVAQEVDVVSYNQLGTNAYFTVKYLKYNGKMMKVDSSHFKSCGIGFTINKHILMLFKKYLSTHQLDDYIDFKFYEDIITLRSAILYMKTDGVYLEYKNYQLTAYFGDNIEYTKDGKVTGIDEIKDNIPNYNDVNVFHQERLVKDVNVVIKPDENKITASKISELEETIKQIKEEAHKLIARNAELHNEADKLKEDNTKLAEKTVSLAIDNLKLKNEAVSLMTVNFELEKEIKKLKEENDLFKEYDIVN